MYVVGLSTDNIQSQTEYQFQQMTDSFMHTLTSERKDLEVSHANHVLSRNYIRPACCIVFISLCLMLCMHRTRSACLLLLACKFGLFVLQT